VEAHSDSGVKGLGTMVCSQMLY